MDNGVMELWMEWNYAWYGIKNSGLTVWNSVRWLDGNYQKWFDSLESLIIA